MLLKTYSSIIPIALSSALTAMANGFLASYLPSRMGINAIDPSRTSDFVAAFAIGMLCSCLFSAQIVKRVGHIRAFSVFACLSGIGALLLPTLESYAAWIVIRFINGYCGNSIFLVAQGWLNDQTESKYRGQILTTFYIIYLIGLGGGAYSVTFFDLNSLQPFMFATVLYMLSVFPVALTKLPAPPPPMVTRIMIRRLWQMSPVALIGCFIGGATAMTMQGLGAVIGQNIGLDYTQIGFMMAIAQAGNLMQFPLGYLSDKVDRRYVLFICGTGLSIFGFIFGNLDANSFLFLVITIAFFIGLGEATLTIALANANDRAAPDEYTSIAGTASLSWCLGAILGPIFGSLTIGTMGPKGVSLFFVIISASFAVFTLWRCLRRETVSEEDHGDFYAAPAEIATSEVYMTEDPEEIQEAKN
ncbi:MFS transporter [Curvivirga sp.]|uniref:MFS transporter n=1 Tax=Curvivirga sp. TaxID=2856848 RepID=UPI003B5C1792